MYTMPNALTSFWSAVHVKIFTGATGKSNSFVMAGIYDTMQPCTLKILKINNFIYQVPGN